MADLTSLLARLREDAPATLRGASEQAVCQAAILPILGALGWDRDNIREVSPQFSVGDGLVDYCLRPDGKACVFVEAKRPTEDLEKHSEQLLRYAFGGGVPIAALTNGLSWWFYLPLAEGTWEERKAFSIDIEHQDIPRVAEHFTTFLSKAAITAGSAISALRAAHSSKRKQEAVTNALPRAWRTLCEEPDELLIDLVSDKVESICGHKPERDTVAAFLSRLPSAGGTRASVPLKPDKGTKSVENYTSAKAHGFSFRGQSHSVTTWKQIVVDLATELSQTHPNDFADRVLLIQGRKGKKYFTRGGGDMIEPRQIGASDIYVETCLSSNSVIKLCETLLKAFGYSREQFKVASDR